MGGGHFLFQIILWIFVIMHAHLQYMPWYENETIFGAKWLMVLWNASIWEVWKRGESFGMSFFICLESIRSDIFSLAFDPIQKEENKLF